MPSRIRYKKISEGIFMDNVEEKKAEYNKLKAEVFELTEEFIKEFSSNKDYLYLFCPKGIGDFLITAGLSHALEEKFDKKATILIAHEKIKRLGVVFPNVAKITAYPSQFMASTSDWFHSTQNYVFDNFIYANFHYDGKKPIWNDKLNIIDRFKENALDIPLDTPFWSPIVVTADKDTVAALNEKYTLDKDKTIVLAPYAVTYHELTKQTGENFWKDMAKRLKDKGYIVYTNVNGLAEKPIEGTEPLTTTFSELYYISDKVKCFVGVRSGIFDFLAMSEAKLFNLIPFGNWFWDIALIYPESNSVTYHYTAEFKKNVVDNYFKKFGVTYEAQFHHKFINCKYISDSLDYILESIMDDIEKL